MYNVLMPSSKMKHFFTDMAAAIAAAILFYLASPNHFDPMGCPLLAWVFAVPLFFVLDGKSLRERLVFGALFSLTAYALLLGWILNVNKFLFVFFTLLFAMQPVLFAGFFKSCAGHRMLRVLCLPSLWVMTEAARSFLIGGYAWTIGHSQAFLPDIVQIADLTGAYGISFLIILVNSGLYFSLKNKKSAPVFLAAVFLAGALLYGRLAVEDTLPGTTVTVCTIQPDISKEEKLNPDALDATVDKQLALSERCFAAKTPDLVVWPETSVSDDVINDGTLRQKIQAFISKHPVAMLIGSAMLVDGKNYNSAVLFDKTGQPEGIYHKQHLLPFNEYFPFQDKLLFLQKIFHLNNYEFRQGKWAGPLPFKKGDEKGNFGVAICSEEGYPALLRKEAAQGALFFVAMLNDAWFKSDAAAMLHAQNGFIQAASLKLPVVRSANSGFTCAIDRYGRSRDGLKNDLKLGEKEVFIFEISLLARRTFYAVFGDVFILVCGFVWLLAARDQTPGK
ncbi:MAG: apolipoprotein N-acyltransferase [Candidatus Omnitrophota bacterium]